VPSDAKRVGHIYKLVADGYENKLLISHDIYKHGFVRVPFLTTFFLETALENVTSEFCFEGQMRRSWLLSYLSKYITQNVRSRSST